MAASLAMYQARERKKKGVLVFADLPKPSTIVLNYRALAIDVMTVNQL